MHAYACVLESLYVKPPPDPLAQDLRGLVVLARDAWQVRGLGRSGMEEFLRLLPMSAADFLDEWFECDPLKGILGAAGVMHVFHGPRSGGTAFNLLHQLIKLLCTGVSIAIAQYRESTEKPLYCHRLPYFNFTANSLAVAGSLPTTVVQNTGSGFFYPFPIQQNKVA